MSSYRDTEKRSIELHKEGKSLSEIAKIIFGDEKKKPLIQLWLK
jgi:DNA-binding CsgD family transcriptional regulator